MDQHHVYPPFERLTAKQREALRLRAANYRVKQIAAAMGGISENTVNTYLSTATHLLGSPGRAAAAAQLIAYESDHPNMRGRFSVGDAEAPQVVLTVAAEEPQPGVPWATVLPLRLGKGTPHDLSPAARFVWIVLLAVFLVIGFGQLVAAAHFLNGLLP